MRRELIELRILPPLAIGRLGSSPDPMDNYDLVIRDPVGPRQIEPAETLRVDRKTGSVSRFTPKAPLRFKDRHGVRPVAPFLEVWARLKGESKLRPLTVELLRAAGLKPDSVSWRVQVANLKIFRRTAVEADKIATDIRPFSDHKVHRLSGRCRNFLPRKTVSLGSVQYILPSRTLPEIRFRFTPAGGKVYGLDPADNVYDSSKGTWQGQYSEPQDNTQGPAKGRLLTQPFQTFAGENKGGDKDSKLVSAGYIDDECDGFVEVEIRNRTGPMVRAFARIASGPPAFAPDSMPVRTVGDELEQAMFGPRVNGRVTVKELREVVEIVRRAMETACLMNAAQLNAGSLQPGSGMARHDTKDWHRALEPMFEPSVAETVAIASRHQRVLLGVESGSLVWFANALRDFDQVADLSTEGRRKMPGLMRGSDGMHLALTRRQVDKIRKVAAAGVRLMSDRR